MLCTMLDVTLRAMLNIMLYAMLRTTLNTTQRTMIDIMLHAMLCTMLNGTLRAMLDIILYTTYNLGCNAARNVGYSSAYDIKTNK